MDTDLTRVKPALAEISDVKLRALIAATYGVPQIAPGLLAWIDGACERPHQSTELDRPKAELGRPSIDIDTVDMSFPRFVPSPEHGVPSTSYEATDRRT